MVEQNHSKIWESLDHSKRMEVILFTHTFPAVVNKTWAEISSKLQERLKQGFLLVIPSDEPVCSLPSEADKAKEEAAKKPTTVVGTPTVEKKPKTQVEVGFEKIKANKQALKTHKSKKVAKAEAKAEVAANHEFKAETEKAVDQAIASLAKTNGLAS